MLTRGHLIGEIVDHLTDLQHQLTTRGQLGLTDLHRFVENFFRDVLNSLCGYRLKNLNDKRSNEPGLDLGDELASVAFQVTSQRTSAKVTDTLQGITEEQRRQFSRIIILIAGRKQTTYTIEKGNITQFAPEEDIWDLGTLCHRAMDLSIDDLQSLHSLVQRNFAKVRIELEARDAEGRYPTTLRSYTEKQPTPRIGDGSQCAAHLNAKHGDGFYSRDTIAKEIQDLARALSFMPRMTRELFAFLIENRDKKRDSHDRMHYSLLRLKRQLPNYDLDGEIILLSDYGLVFSTTEDIEIGEDIQYQPILEFGNEALVAMIEHADDTGTPVERFIVDMDFGGF